MTTPDDLDSELNYRLMSIGVVMPIGHRDRLVAWIAAREKAARIAALLKARDLCDSHTKYGTSWIADKIGAWIDKERQA